MPPSDPERSALDDEIELYRMVVTSADAEPAWSARLGYALLTRYEQDTADGDRSAPPPEDLEDGLAHLGDALAASPDALAAPAWRYALGLGLSYRHEHSGDPADCARAIELLELSVRQSSGDPGTLADVMPELVDLHWRRFLSADHSTAGGTLAAADALLRAVNGLPHVQQSTAGAAMTTLAGIAHLERHRVAGDPGDLERAAQLLDAARPYLDRSEPLAVDAWLALSDACLAEADGTDRTWLDRAVQAAVTARSLLESSDPLVADCLRHEVRCVEARWHGAGQRADLERAIGCYEQILALDEQADAWTVFRLGDLRLERAGSDVESVRDAITVLEEAVRRSSPDDEEAWDYHYTLASARIHAAELAGREADAEAVVEGFGAALRSGVPDPELALHAHLQRVLAMERWMRRRRFDRSVVEIARTAVEEASEAVLAAAEECPETAAGMAGAQVIAEMWISGHDGRRPRLEVIRRLLALARTLQDRPPFWRGLIGLGEGMAQLADGAWTGHWSGPSRDTVQLLADAVRDIGDDETLGRYPHFMLGFVRLAAALRAGDLRGLAAALRVMRWAGAGLDDSEADSLRLLRLLTAAAHAERQGQTRRAESMIAKASLVLDAIPSAPATDAIRPLVRLMTSAQGGPRRAAEVAGPHDDEPTGPAPSPYDDALGVASLAADALAASHRGDTAAARELLRLLGERQQDWPEGSVAGQLGVAALAAAWLQLAQQGEPGAAAEAVRWNELHLRGLGPPTRYSWADAAMQLARAHRLAGSDPAMSRRAALAALRAHAWEALAQSGTEEALDSAHRATKDTMAVAGWCAADGVPDDVVHALETGRGMVLHAATAARTVADELRAAGHPDLADEWTAAGGGPGSLDLGAGWRFLGLDDVPDDLRERILGRLVGAGHAGLLDPPTIDEIRRSLAMHGSDALVYLVPQGDETDGMAVVVPRDGAVGIVRLPALSTLDGSPLSSYLETYAAYTSVRAPHRSSPGGRRPLAGRVRGRRQHARWHRHLDELCAWAWDAAMSPVLHDARARTPGRQPRLVLVPVGPLALVPWHAASYHADGARRYLVQHAVVSVAPSARLFCRAVGQPPLGPGGALVVGNPTGDLLAAGREARAVHEVFHHRGRYLGLVESGQRLLTADAGGGTVDEVLGWLVDASSPRSVVHLACHAVADPARPSRSHLVLRGGTELRVGDLLAKAPTATLPIDRVFLSACTTHLVGADYDEAFSLSAAFLAAGARTVFGSLWQVPDDGTARLMYMVHHYLRDGVRPADALCAAQRWMLDPDRTPPPDMPGELAEGIDVVDLAAVASWGGFVHMGV